MINLNGMNFQFGLAGEGAIFFSTIAYAFSSVFVKKFSQKFNPVMLSAYQFIIGGIVLMAAGGVMGGHITKSDTKWNRTAGLSGAGFSSGIFPLGHSSEI